MKGLLIVDVQNDFCPGGALAVPEGDAVVPVINRLMEEFDIIVASKDWHPPDTVHFQKWPVHCVQGTHGAEFHPRLLSARVRQVFLKGTGNADDGYSAFEATSASLTEYLKARDVTELYVTGLATDYCVRASALDAAAQGMATHIVTDAIAAVNVQATDGEKALEEMRRAGVHLVSSTDLIGKRT